MSNDVDLFILEPPDAIWVNRIVEGYLARDDDADVHEVRAARVFARQLRDWSVKHV